jgi:Streptomyces sporulation and cell division protein, SsgA
MTQHTAVVHEMITAATEMLLISDPAIPVGHAELRYDCDDPFAVQMLLTIDESPAIRWVFGRDLLITGASMPSGVGDVQLYPTHDGIIIELRSSTASVALLAYAPDIAAFIDRTLAVVPIDTELDHYDIDGELMVLLPVHD